MILDNPKAAIAEYNRRGVHYNLAAEGIYRRRVGIDPFSEDFEPIVIAGLLAFDMGRMMGSGDKYAVGNNAFRSRLRPKMRALRTMINGLSESRLHETDLVEAAASIRSAYGILADPGPEGLSSDPGDHFHVGATKILHWLAPSLFIMVDANVARAFSVHHNVKYSKTTQPGYTAQKYIECLSRAQDEIRRFGSRSFLQLEPDTPIARLFDKAAWVAGLPD